MVKWCFIFRKGTKKQSVANDLCFCDKIGCGHKYKVQVSSNTSDISFAK